MGGMLTKQQKEMVQQQNSKKYDNDNLRNLKYDNRNGSYGKQKSIGKKM